MTSIGLFRTSLCSAEPGPSHPSPLVASLQIHPFIAHSRCCSKCCWANLACSAILKLPRELRNKNSALVATFLRLGIVASSPIADCYPKKRRKWLCRGLLLRCQGGRESAIAKKLQRSRDFCFHNGLSAATGQIRRKTCEASDGNGSDLWKGEGVATVVERIARSEGSRADPVKGSRENPVKKG